jgi:hypothetical protein
VHGDDNDVSEDTSTEDLPDDEEPMEWYHIEVPPLLPGTASQVALQAENMMLCDIIKQAGIALEEDYAQTKLMDLENKRLRKQAFKKEKQKKQNKLTSGHAQHMMAAENLELPARQNWEGQMKDVFKEAAPQFKILKKKIVDHEKAIEKAKKMAEHEAKKVAVAVARGCGRGRGARGARGGRGRGSRDMWGRATTTAQEAGAESRDSDSDSFEMTEPLESSSDSESESEAEIPVPRSHR